MWARAHRRKTESTFPFSPCSVLLSSLNFKAVPAQSFEPKDFPLESNTWSKEQFVEGLGSFLLCKPKIFSGLLDILCCFCHLSFDQTLLGGNLMQKRVLDGEPRGLSSDLNFVITLSLTFWVLCLLTSYLRGLDQMPFEILISSFLRGLFKLLQYMLL